MVGFGFGGGPAVRQDRQNGEESITHNEVRISGRRLMAFSPGRRDLGCEDQSALVGIAVRVAGDSRGGVAIAELAAANVVAGVGAELRAVENFEETASANLARDGGEGVLRGGGAGCGVLRGVGDAGAGTAVGVANEDAAGFVHRDVVEVEQIAARIAAAAVPYAATLHGIGGRGVDSGPNAAGVVGEGDVEMPEGEEVGGLRVAGGLRAEEGEGGAVVVAGHYLGELRVLYAEGSAGVFGFQPMQSAVRGCSDFGVPVGIYVAQINGVVRARRDGRIAAGADALGIGNRAHRPTKTVVGGDGNADAADAISVHAAFVGDVGSAIGRNANVAVQAAASAGGDGEVDAVDGSECVDRDAGAES